MQLSINAIVQDLTPKGQGKQSPSALTYNPDMQVLQLKASVHTAHPNLHYEHIELLSRKY